MRFAPGHRRHRRQQGGFSVLEFIVAMSLLAVVLLPAAKLMISAIVVSGNTRSRVVATNLASQSIETLRGNAQDLSTFWNPPPLGRTATTSFLNNIVYTVTRDIEWVGQGQSGSNCSSGGTAPNLLRVTSSVTWPNMLGAQPVQSTTDFAPPVGAFSLTNGAIAASVVDSRGAPLSYVTVSLSGPTSSLIVTGADGCAFFGYTTSGTYTVSAARLGYVSDQGLATPTYTNVVVSASQTVSRSFVLDQSATIAATLAASPAAAGGMPLSVDNSSLSPYGFVAFPPAQNSLSPLFPYPSGYTPFAGSCTDSDPMGKTTGVVPFYPTPSGAAVPTAALTPVNTPPGGTTASAVPLYPLTLLSQLGTTGVAGSSLSAIPTLAGSAISPKWSASINWVCPAPVPTYQLAVTIAGGLSTTGIGLGHYTIVQTSKPTTALAYVWVEPDGTHSITNTSTTATVAAAPSTVTVTVTSLP